MSNFDINSELLNAIYNDAVTIVNSQEKSHLNYKDFIKNGAKEQLIARVRCYFYDNKRDFETHKDLYIAKNKNQQLEKWNNIAKKGGGTAIALGAMAGSGYINRDISSIPKRILISLGVGIVIGGLSYVALDELSIKATLKYYSLHPITESQDFDIYLKGQLLNKMKEEVSNYVKFKLIQLENARQKELYENKKREMLEKIQNEDADVVLTPELILKEATKALAKTQKKLKKLEVERKELKEEIRDPISGELFANPVPCPDGLVYEHQRLKDFYQKQLNEIQSGLYPGREFPYPGCPTNMSKELPNPENFSRDHNTHLKMKKYHNLLERKDHLKEKINKRDSFLQELIEERHKSRNARSLEGDISIPM